MIVLAADILARHGERSGVFPLRFRCMDDGDVYSSIAAEGSASAVPGSISFWYHLFTSRSPNVGRPEDCVRVIFSGCQWCDSRATIDVGSRTYQRAAGYVYRGDHWEADSVQVVEIGQELSARTQGLFETTVLAGKRVFTGGLGSVGSSVALELAKVGVGHHDLMDHDRVEAGNVVRHVAGLSDVGRLKTKVVRDVIQDKNPSAIVETCDQKISWETKNVVERFVSRSDLVICAADTREARLILNLVCVKHDKPLIVAGAFRRAYGGQILVVRPRSGPCYQCFLMHLTPEQREGRMRHAEWTAPVAYSDRPAPIEPGLSNDIAPLNQMIVKLAIQSLLQGQSTTLRSLDEDLVAPWYRWLNRREPRTDYEQMEPLGFGADGGRILCWYGLALNRNSACPVCGNYVDAASQNHGVEITQSEIDVFASDRSV